MSWDVSLYRFSQRYQSLDEIPEDEQPFALGSLKEIQLAVSAAFPGTSWADPIWGIFKAEFGSVEFNVGKEEPVVCLALHVRAGDAVLGGIFDLCNKLHCQAIDLSYSTFLDQAADPASGLEQWRAYRDQIVSGQQV